MSGGETALADHGHSPLGGSATHRFMKCPGSVTLSRGHLDSESDHAALGTAAHKLGELCLTLGRQPWTFIGEEIEGFRVDKDMAAAVEVYVDYVWRLFGRHLRGSNSALIEHPFQCPALHPLYYSRIDFGHVNYLKRELTVVDYKHGAGVVVEVPWNPQGLYYAAGLMESLGLWHEVDTIRIVIVQPRGFHYSGPVREWTISTGDLDGWLVEKLLPAMDRALVSRDTQSGEHCRFCPARSKACPQLVDDMDELREILDMIQSKEKGAEELTNEQIERFLELTETAKIVRKAAEQTAFNRLQNGSVLQGWKLGKAKVNREWKAEAEAELKKHYGNDAFETKVKSPAQIEKLPEGENFTARYAFKPEAGLALIRMDDARPAVNRDTKSLFKPVKKSRT